MARYINAWTTLAAWAALMGIVWTLFVPKGLSVGTFTLLGLTAPVLLAAGSALWKAQRPSPSIRQMRATIDAEERPGTSA
jgi:hypothetical protein